MIVKYFWIHVEHFGAENKDLLYMDATAITEKDNLAVAKRMREALEASGITQAELARRMSVAPHQHVSPQQVHGWLKTGTIGKALLLRFAQETGADLGYLMTGKGPATAQAPAKYAYVPKYAAIGGLGTGRINQEHVEVSGTHAYRREWLERQGLDAESLAVIEAEGPSMADTVNDGDVVLVNLAETTIISGRVYAIEDPIHGVRIKRLHKQLDGRIRVESDNPDKRLYPDDYITPDTQARVIGRVVHRSGSV